MMDSGAIQKMLDLPDDKLMMMLQLVLSGAGIKLPSGKIDASSVRKIRALLGEITDDDIARLTYLMECYRKGG